ncbi:DMT family transporter [Ancylobacter sp. Lp-2]|uniref:DMT family transporter n=1 Tax=Ancylobacter sp. Lp-2 TaxID=2881339 RepID=UPI001E2EEEF4|nr:DMT family transporter [Ancylobacter sp. Lp-2]MCB4768230.1 DMT family transporter [Ancylobacter sp. Lp-2]
MSQNSLSGGNATLPAEGAGAVSSRQLFALVLAFCLLWSSAFAFAKMALMDCPPLILLVVRLTLAGGIMLALAAKVDGRARLASMRRRDVYALILCGILNNAVYLGVNWIGLTITSSGYNAVLISCNPLVVALLAGPLLGERLNLTKWLGLGLGLLGVVIVLRSRLVGGHEDAFGTLLIGIGMLGLAAGTLAFKYFKPRGGVWTGNAIQCLTGAVVLLPFAALTESLADVHVTGGFLVGLGFLVFAVSIGGYGLWFFLLTRSSATAASSLHFAMPPLGLFFGWLLLGERVPALDIIGILPIALGIWLVTRSSRQAGTDRPAISASNS